MESKQFIVKFSHHHHHFCTGNLPCVTWTVLINNLDILDSFCELFRKKYSNWRREYTRKIIFELDVQLVEQSRLLYSKECMPVKYHIWKRKWNKGDHYLVTEMSVFVLYAVSWFGPLELLANGFGQAIPIASHLKEINNNNCNNKNSEITKRTGLESCHNKKPSDTYGMDRKASGLGLQVVPAGLYIIARS